MSICPHYETCGGCSLQHLSEEEYKQTKYSPIIEEFKGKLGTTPEIITIGPHSRRRGTFQISNNKLGFFESKSHNIIAISECRLLVPEIEKLIKPLNSLIPIFKKLKEISITSSDTGLDILFNSDKDTSLNDLETLSKFSNDYDVSRISWKQNDSITPIAQKNPISIKFKDWKILLPEENFLQASKQCLEEITSRLLKHHANSKNILDLYAGCGAYSVPLASLTKVHSVDSSKAMMASLKNTANFNQIHSLTTEARNLYKHPFSAKELEEFDSIIINPPRKGAHPTIYNINNTTKMTVSTISCNPKTFLFDARELLEKGYKIKELILIDQFHWTPHIEIYALFSNL